MWRKKADYSYCSSVNMTISEHCSEGCLALKLSSVRLAEWMFWFLIQGQWYRRWEQECHCRQDKRKNCRPFCFKCSITKHSTSAIARLFSLPLLVSSLLLFDNTDHQMQPTIKSSQLCVLLSTFYFLWSWLIWSKATLRTFCFHFARRSTLFSFTGSKRPN